MPNDEASFLCDAPLSSPGPARVGEQRLGPANGCRPVVSVLLAERLVDHGVPQLVRGCRFHLADGGCDVLQQHEGRRTRHRDKSEKRPQRLRRKAWSLGRRGAQGGRLGGQSCLPYPAELLQFVGDSECHEGRAAGQSQLSQ